nr:40S ribosomal protein S8 [Microcebus murinus]
MGISRDNWHKRRKTGGKRKPYHKKRKYELGRPAANTKIGPRRIHTVRVRGGNKKYRALRLDVGNFSWGSECCTRKTRIIDVVYNASNNELVRTKTLVKNCIVLIDSTPYRQWYESHYALPLGRKKGAKLTPEEEEILNKKRSKKIQKKYDERKKSNSWAQQRRCGLAVQWLRLRHTWGLHGECGAAAATNMGWRRAHEPACRRGMMTPGKKKVLPGDCRQLREWGGSQPLRRSLAGAAPPERGLGAGEFRQTGASRGSGFPPPVSHIQGSPRDRLAPKRRKDRGKEKALPQEARTHCIASRPGQCGRADGYVLEGKELEFYLRKIKARKGK